MSHLEIYIDGASKGNPGRSGVGIVIYRDGLRIKNISNYIGTATNNVAEYTVFLPREFNAFRRSIRLVKEGLTYG